jgi:hypothetical protein
MKKVVLLLLSISMASAQTSETDILKNWLLPAPASSSLYGEFSKEAFRLLRLRQEKVAAIHTADELASYQKTLRLTLQQVVGAFPERTPLNALVTGRIKKPGYRIEKLLFESQPGYFVTACLFLPKTGFKRPAVLYCSGHSANGFRSEAYQTAILNLVLKGFVVLAFDPISQGERLQYFDPATGKSTIGGPTSEHSYVGAQCFITGYSPALYWIWDGIRAIDYLVSRKEVDPSRIGITGRSGGGTQSAYIAAFDERIVASAPECYITSFCRLFESVGPQDAEQNFMHGLVHGIDHADLLLVRAPKPTLLITTTRDMFSIQGVRETYAEVSRFYEMHHAADHLNMVEDDTIHASTQKNRQAMYAFFQKYLNVAGDPHEQSIQPLQENELQVTSQGQVALLAGNKTQFDINRIRAERLIAGLVERRKTASDIKKIAEELTGYKPPTGCADLVFAGRHVRPDYMMDKYFLQLDLPLPFILLSSTAAAKAPAPLVLFLHPEGKAAFQKEQQNILKLIRHGYMVALPDLAGCGESPQGKSSGDSYNFSVGKAPYNIWFAGIQVGSSLVGRRSGQIALLVETLKQQSDVDSSRISAIAFETMGPVLLHSAAFLGQFEKIGLNNSFLSYQDIVTRSLYRPEYIMSSVAGSLGHYDLQDLAAALAPRPLWVINGRDGTGACLNIADAKKEWSFAQQVFDQSGGAENLRFAANEQFDIYENW